MTVILGILYNISVILVTWSYIKILCTSPGHPSNELKYERAELYERLKNPTTQSTNENTTHQIQTDLELDIGRYEPVNLNTEKEEDKRPILANPINEVEDISERKENPRSTPHPKHKIENKNATYRY